MWLIIWFNYFRSWVLHFRTMCTSNKDLKWLRRSVKNMLFWTTIVTHFAIRSSTVTVSTAVHRRKRSLPSLWRNAIMWLISLSQTYTFMSPTNKFIPTWPNKGLIIFASHIHTTRRTLLGSLCYSMSFVGFMWHPGGHFLTGQHNYTLYLLMLLEVVLLM